jgi:hypothetical protein
LDGLFAGILRSALDAVELDRVGNLRIDFECANSSSLASFFTCYHVEYGGNAFLSSRQSEYLAVDGLLEPGHFYFATDNK